MTFENTLREISKFHFILSEGRKGNHLLFSPQIIRQTFEKNQVELAKSFEENLERINDILNHTFSIQSFEEKREYLGALPLDLQCTIVFGYFQLLDGELFFDGAIDGFPIERPRNRSKSLH